MKIARRLEKVTPSLTLEVTSLARQMREQGKGIINFAAGEPDFDTPQYIKKAAIEAIKKDLPNILPPQDF